MNPRDLERYRKLLLAKRDELSAPDEARTPVPSARDPGGDLMDQASADVAAELQIQLHATDALLLKEIEDSLARIRAGTFGVCEACRQPVSNARLEAVPWAPLCHRCKEQQTPEQR